MYSDRKRRQGKHLQPLIHNVHTCAHTRLFAPTVWYGNFHTAASYAKIGEWIPHRYANKQQQQKMKKKIRNRRCNVRKWVCPRNLLASHKKEMPQKEAIQIKYSGHICAYVAKHFCEHTRTNIHYFYVSMRVYLSSQKSIHPWMYFEGLTASCMWRTQTQCVYRNLWRGDAVESICVCYLQYTLVYIYGWVFAYVGVVRVNCLYLSI